MMNQVKAQAYSHDEIEKDEKGRVIPQVGMVLQADGWKSFCFYTLSEGTNYSDSSFAGCAFYYYSDTCDTWHAVNIKTTGKKEYYEAGGYYRVRCQIEWVGDGQPSDFGKGWLYFTRYF